MPFETFSRRSLPPVKQPIVTVQKRGALGFNHAAYVAMGNPTQLELLFDPDEQMIGLRGVDEGTTHAYKVRPLASDTSYVVSGRAFTRYYGIDTTESRKYEATMVEDILCIDLKSSSEVVTSNRNGTGASKDEGPEDNSTEVPEPNQPELALRSAAG